MALSIGFRIFSFLPSCYSSYGALNFYPGGTFTHCSCQPSLDAHFSGRILNSGDPRTECAVVLGAQCWSRRACYEKRDLHIESRALRSGPLRKPLPPEWSHSPWQEANGKAQGEKFARWV